jgi:hypothetical protein
MKHRALFALIAALLGLTLNARAAITIAEPEPHTVTVDRSGNAAITLNVMNTGQTAVALTTSEFTHKVGSASPYRVGGSAVPSPATLPAVTAPVAVKFALSGITEAGDSLADIYASGEKATTLTAIRVPAAYNVQIEGQNPEAVFAPGRKPFVKLVNSDGTAYRFSWELFTGSDLPAKPPPEFDIPAGGSVRLDLSAVAPSAPFLSAGTLKDDLREANIVLHPLLAPTAIGIPPQPDKWLPLKVRTRYWPDLWQQFVTAVFTFLLLAIGAFASLWMHYFIPNTSAMLRLVRRSQDMLTRLGGMGDDLSPRWHIIIDARIKRSSEKLSSMPRAYPGYATVLAEVDAELAMFGQWLDVAYDISVALAEARHLQQECAPPTAVKLIDDRMQEALDPILSGFTGAAEIQAMQAARNKVQQLVAALKDGLASPDLEAAIKDREQRLLPDIAKLKEDFPDFSSLFDVIDKAAASALTPSSYLDRDTFSVQGELLQRYRAIAGRAGITTFPPPMPAGAKPANDAERIAKKDPQFREYVRPESFRSLAIAGVFIAEMRQDFYPEALLAEMAHDNAIELRADPPKPAPGDPVHVSIRFRREQLNEIAAIREWSVRWTIDGVLWPGTKWDLYFAPGPSSKPLDVAAEFVDLAGGVMTPNCTLKVPLAATADARPASGWFSRLRRFSPEAKTEALRLGFALAVVLAGLFSSARDKVDSLGLLSAAAAVIALGFVVNTAKEIVIGKPSTN